jgi:predicted ATPase
LVYDVRSPPMERAEGRIPEMTIQSFTFHDGPRDWSLEEMRLGQLNLLVGISGVGKTRILEALKSVRRSALEDSRETNGCAWTLRLDIGGEAYCWSAETSIVAHDPWIVEPKLSDDEEYEEYEPTSLPRFLKERIEIGSSETLVERENGKFVFDGKKLPRLKSTESAITLLRDEEKIRPLRQALGRFIFSEAQEIQTEPFEIGRLSQAHAVHQHPTLQTLQDATYLHLLLRAYLLEKLHPEEFRAIQDEFMAIFPSVEDLKLIEKRPLDIHDLEIVDERQKIAFSESNVIAMGIREYGVPDWIPQRRISSGMMRVLVHLFEVALAPPGTVIAIDEFENSLGVNCLPEITDHLLRRARDLQFILTSHHPYVINNIPKRYWKLVTRRKSAVSVVDAAKVSSLDTASRHEDFFLLMNSPEYEEGIA